MSDYKPISCAASDQLEAAIVTGKALRLRLKETIAEPSRTLDVDPLDIEVESGAEFLRYRIRASGLETRVRLDRIRDFEVMEGHTA